MESVTRVLLIGVAGVNWPEMLAFFRAQCVRSSVDARLRADYATLGGDNLLLQKIETFAQAQTNDLPGILPYGPLHEAILALHLLEETKHDK